MKQFWVLGILAAASACGSGNDNNTAAGNATAATQANPAGATDVPPPVIEAVGPPQADCVGQAEQAIVFDLVRKNQNNTLMKALAAQNADVAGVGAMVEMARSFGNEPDTPEEIEADKRWKEYKADIDQGTYSLENVRVTAKDPTLNNATCAAELKIETSQFGWAKVPVTYKVEMTADGKPYATVYGIWIK